MKIEYRNFAEYIPVDVEKLRPKGSYGELMAKRSHPIDTLIQKHGKIPTDFLIHQSCPNCGSDDSIHELSKDHLDAVRCRICSLVYVTPLFNQEHYEEIYRSKEYSEIVKSLVVTSHEYRVKRFGNERVEIMKRWLPDSLRPKYLDVGCATGFVVEAARDAGWDATGVEMNPDAVEFGRSRELNLIQGKLQSVPLGAETFDAISLFDVLEHIHDPGGIVEHAVSLLRPGGILFVYVPNYDSASRMLMGTDAHFIWPTHHLTYFNITTISDFMRRRGLAVEYVVTEGMDLIDYVWQQEEIHKKDQNAIRSILDPLQFFINAGGYGKNLRIIARKPARK